MVSPHNTFHRSCCDSTPARPRAPPPPPPGDAPLRTAKKGGKRAEQKSNKE